MGYEQITEVTGIKNLNETFTALQNVILTAVETPHAKRKPNPGLVNKAINVATTSHRKRYGSTRGYKHTVSSVSKI